MGLYPDAAPVPDAKTIWPCREQLTRPGAPGRAFTRFDAPPRAQIVLTGCLGAESHQLIEKTVAAGGFEPPTKGL